MLYVQNNVQHITKAVDKKFLNFELTSYLFLECLIFQGYQYVVSYERNSLTEVNATNHAETTSDRMATIPPNLESKRITHNSLQFVSSTINTDLHKSS